MENTDLTPEEQAYSERLFKAVLDLVITLDTGADAHAGVVQLDIVRSMMIDVAAAVDHNCGLGRLPKERRETGERLGKRYARLLKGMNESAIDEGWPKAMPVAGMKPN